MTNDKLRNAASRILDRIERSPIITTIELDEEMRNGLYCLIEDTLSAESYLNDQ